MKTLGITLIYLFVNMSTLAAAEPKGAKEFNQAMAPVVQSYLEIQQNLAADKITNISKAAETILGALKTLDVSKIQGKNANHYINLPKELASAVQAIAKAEDLSSARKAFYTVSRPITMWASTAKPANTTLAFCPMADGGWLQKKGPLRNPYYGSQMLECGEFIQFAAP